MITIGDLKKIAKGRLKDADVLCNAGRYDGAVYLAGYAVEIALKAQISRTLKWAGYPATGGEFKDYSTFKTHDLDVLLHLSGREVKIKTRYLAEWSIVATWDPITRYRAIGTASNQDANDMVNAARTIVANL